jgi:hypothetical protein
MLFRTNRIIRKHCIKSGILRSDTSGAIMEEILPVARNSRKKRSGINMVIMST